MTDDSTPSISSSSQRFGVASPLNARTFTPLFRALPGKQQQFPSSPEALRDVELRVQVELGRTRMSIDDFSRLEAGAVIELDRQAADAVDVFVNDQLIARGEVVVINGKFAVRVTEVTPPFREERAR